MNENDNPILKWLQSLPLPINTVPGTNTNSNKTVGTQQVQRKVQVEDETPKTRLEGQFRNWQRRRKTGKSVDQEATERRLAEANQRTWRSDVADVFHGIGEGAMMLNPYTATSYFGAKALNNLRKGDKGSETTLDIAFATMPLANNLTNLAEKGFQYASNVIPRIARFGISNHTGNWTLFGNNMYRIKPGYIGINGVGIERKPLNAISVEELLPEAKYLTTRFAEISHPELVRDLATNHSKGDIVEALALGEQVELPLFNNSGVKPNVGTVVEVMENGRPLTLRYITTLKGTLPIEGKYKTHKSMGGFDYSAGGENALDNAVEYIAIERPWEASVRLGQRYGYGSPLYKYTMERVNLINDLSKKYNIKWGKDTRNLENVDWDDFEALKRAINPKSIMKNSRSTNDLDMGMLDKIAKSVMSPEDFLRYKLAVREYSEFWGSGEKALQAGGVHQQAIAIPDLFNRVKITFPKIVEYDNLRGGTLYKGRDSGIPLNITPVEGKYNMNAVAQYLNKLNYPYFSVEPILDPNVGITHAAKPRLITRGMKNGGKIK